MTCLPHTAPAASSGCWKSPHIEWEDVANRHQADQHVLCLIDRGLIADAQKSIEAGLDRGQLDRQPRSALELCSIGLR